MNTAELAAHVVAYMEAKGYQLFKAPGQVNIVYLEGSDEEGQPNADRLDEWNDRRLVILFRPDGTPDIVHNVIATTEPGRAATLSANARKLGGVARIAFGQHFAWQEGFHKQQKYGKTHPALVQCAPIPVHRDFNQDGKRTGDPIGQVQGLNQHSTREGYAGGPVATWSEGCLVGMMWRLHLAFMALVKADPRYIQDKDFIFASTVIDTDDLAKWKPA